MKAIYTVCNVAHLYKAKTFLDSVRIHQGSDVKLFVCLTEELSEENKVKVEEFFKPSQIILAGCVPQEFVQGLNPDYSTFENTCAFRPIFAEYLLSSVGIENLIYMDADTYLYADLNKSFEDLNKFNIILSIHNNKILDYQHAHYDQLVLKSGIYNSGFLGLSKSENTLNFIRWWRERLKQLCLIDPEKGLFVDQLWLNLVPLYFSNVKVEIDEGYNVGYWNIFSRNITYSNSIYYVNDISPLRFFHFSGMDENNEDNISRHFINETLDNWVNLKELFKEYRHQLSINKLKLEAIFPPIIESVPIIQERPEVKKRKGLLRWLKTSPD